MKKTALILIALFTTALTLPLAQAQTTYTWDGGDVDDNLWTSVDNWDANGVPVGNGNHTLVFNGSTRLTPDNDLTANSTFFSLTFGATSGDFTLDGNLLRLGDAGGGSTVLIVNNGGTKTLDLDIHLNEAAPTFSSSNNPTVILNGLISANNGSTSNFPLVGGGSIWEFTNTNNSFNQIFSIQGSVILRTSQLINAGSNSTVGTSGTIAIGNAGGSGTLQYTGATTMTDRQIRIGGGSATAHTGAGTLSNNGTGAITFTNATFNANSSTNATRTLTFGGNYTGGTNIIQGQINDNDGDVLGTGIVNIAANGSVWELQGNNTYTGTTAVSAGTLSLTGNLTGGGNITTSGTGIFNQSAAGVISGASSFTSSGTSTLAGNNTYTGTTTVNSGGTLIAAHANALGATSGAATVNGGGSLGIQGGITTAAGQDVTINGLGLAGPLSGALRNISGNNTFSGGVTLGSTSSIGSDAGNLNLAGAVTGTTQILNIVGPGTVTLSNTGNNFGSAIPNTNTVGLSVNGGNLISGAAGVIHSNTVAAVLSGSWDLNDFDQTVRGNGSTGLRLGGAAGTATIDTGTGTLTINGTGLNRITFVNTNDSSGGVINGKIAYDGGNDSFLITTQDSSNAEFELTINAAISKGGAANAGTFYFTGTGTTLLTGASTFDPDSLQIRGGTVVLGANDTVNSNGPLGNNNVRLDVGNTDLAAAAFLLRNGISTNRAIRTTNASVANGLGNSTTTRTVGGYDTTGTATFNNVLQLFNTAAGGNLVRLQALGDSTVTFNGAVQRAAADNAVTGINKIGTGNVVLTSGANNFGGDSLVTEGGLILNGGHNTPTKGDFSVASGARIGGSGSGWGSITLESGANFIFTLGSTLTLAADQSLTFGGAFGVTNLLNADGTAIDWSLVGDSTYTLVAGTNLDLIGFGNVTHTISNQFAIGGGRTAYFQQGSLQLVVIPEPSSAALLGLFLGALTLLRRRRA